MQFSLTFRGNVFDTCVVVLAKLKRCWVLQKWLSFLSKQCSFMALSLRIRYAMQCGMRDAGWGMRDESRMQDRGLRTQRRRSGAVGAENAWRSTKALDVASVIGQLPCASSSPRWRLAGIGWPHETGCGENECERLAINAEDLRELQERITILKHHTTWRKLKNYFICLLFFRLTPFPLDY